jgi:2-succinyl-5-enolpyruvyl-6-hydroxy-3-cyclohexene-1-carboxylate synthase
VLASRGASGIDGLVSAAAGAALAHQAAGGGPAAALPGPFERVFGTPHGARIRDLAAAAGIPHTWLVVLC